jgi:hypothetical protein
MSDFRRELRDPDLIAFYEYWLTLCAGRRMPRREDIDPLSIPSGYLADLMLVEVLEEPRRYRYRLIGTHVVEASGEDRTGRYFDEVPFIKRNPVIASQYDAVVARGKPLYSLEPFTNLRTGTAYEVDRLLLPLSSDGERVDMIIVLFQFKTGAHARRLATTNARRQRAGGAASA